MVVILLKSPNDCLQGINKLDYLLKASVFQVYKDARLQDNKKDIDESMFENDNQTDYQREHSMFDKGRETWTSEKLVNASYEETE